MKKVLHIYKSFPPDTIGGVEKYIEHICKGTEEYGVKSRVICLGDTKKHYRINDIEITRYSSTINVSSCPFSISLLFNIRKEAEWADIIHYHYPWPFADLLSLFIPKDKKQIVTYHSDIVKQKALKWLYYPLEQYFLSKVDKIVATSPNYSFSSPNLNKFKSKVIILPIALDKTHYPKPQTPQVKKIRNLYGKDFILFIGQLRYYKGLELLIEAISVLPNQLVILGNGPEYKSLKNLCTSKNINNITFIRTFTEQEKVNYIEASFSLALTSHLRSEAFGLVLLEGAMHSKPLISCEIGTATSYVNKHMETGVVAKPNVESIREAIRYLTCNSRSAHNMGLKASSRIDKIFSYDRICEKLASIYYDL